MKSKILMIAVLLATVFGPAALAQQKPGGAVEATTPAELVESYDSLADSILALKKTESNLVRSILATSFNHAEAVYQAAHAKLQAGRDARADLEKLAALVAQMGNEGDASVARVRKKLLDGGHHHNAAGEQQGIYDPGFVIVTRSSKKAFLGAAAAIGKLGQAGTQGALEKEWQRVKSSYAELAKSGNR